MSSLLTATSPVSFPHSSPLVLLISHVKEDRIKSPSSINTSQPCISDQCLPVCRIIHYYTLHYGLIASEASFLVCSMRGFSIYIYIYIYVIGSAKTSLTARTIITLQRRISSYYIILSILRFLCIIKLWSIFSLLTKFEKLTPFRSAVTAVRKRIQNSGLRQNGIKRKRNAVNIQLIYGTT